MRRTRLLMLLRRSLVDEALRLGMTLVESESYATAELTEYRYTTSQLRTALRES